MPRRRPAQTRVSIRQIPCWPQFCAVSGCVYRDRAGVCDEPRINKGNSDARCHSMLNKELLALLTAAGGQDE